MPITNLSLHVANEPGERQRWLVDFAHEQALQNHSIKLASGPPNKEAVELFNFIDQIISFDLITHRFTKSTSVLKFINLHMLKPNHMTNICIKT